MIIEDQIFATLSANSGLTNLVPAAKIKPPGAWQNLDRPYIVHFAVAPEPIYTHDGRAPLTPWRSYQVSAFADSYSQAVAVANAARGAIEGQHSGVTCFWKTRRPLYEQDSEGAVRIHQIVDEYEVWEAVS